MEDQESSKIKLSTLEYRTLIDDKVRDLILRGKSRPEIIKFISKESERLGAPRTENHCSNIYNLVKHNIRTELKELLGEIYTDLLGKLYYLYEKNMTKNDLKESRECLTLIAKLSGLGNGNSVLITKPDEIIQINFS